MAKYWKRERVHKDEGPPLHEVTLSVNQLPNLASLHPLPYEGREQFLKYGLPLYQAALEGDWDAADSIITQSSYWMNAPINKNNDTVLHIAAAAKHTDFVRNLVNKMSSVDLEYANTLGNTAFCYAVTTGIVEMARVMVERNTRLPNIRGSDAMSPLQMAILLGHKDMVLYLLDLIDHDKIPDADCIELLTSSIESDLFDVALYFLQKDKTLAVRRDGKQETALHTLARKPLKTHEDESNLSWKRFVKLWRSNNQEQDAKEPTMAIKLVKELWEEVIKQDDQYISNIIGQPWRLLFVAAEIGNVEFLTTLIHSYPDIIWKVNEKNHSMFHVAVKYRHENIFKIIHEVGAIKDLIAAYTEPSTGNNMLHLAAQQAPPHRLNCVSGAALQMQHELLWFQAVKEIVQPQYAIATNKNGETPLALFTKEHEELRTRGEEWMKTTANSCTLVATLIATVDFTATFTLPGGTKSNGSPVLVKNASFLVFSIANAISLFASSASILMFLSILTSRYAERDFLKSLPRKLVIGLVSLFISITSMMVAFMATFLIIFREGERWVLFPVSLCAFVPVILYGCQEYSLMLDIFRSTYKSRTLFEFNGKRILAWRM
ncbi:uncharacterized protein LOC141599374 [Silene latifolia]|uniref:uncharacterized protein LOC141599374 n=1 Tax=Silene latifolia TaxID=37657 RepID=UPI003D77A4A5